MKINPPGKGENTMFIVVFGPQGCGKTTNRHTLANYFKCDHIFDDWTPQRHKRLVAYDRCKTPYRERSLEPEVKGRTLLLTFYDEATIKRHIPEAEIFTFSHAMRMAA